MNEYMIMSLMVLGTIIVSSRLWNITGRSQEEIQGIAWPFLGRSICPLVVLEGSIYHRVLRLIGVTALNTFAMGLMVVFSLQEPIDWWWMLMGIVSFILSEGIIIELFRVSRRRKYVTDLHMCGRVLRTTTRQGRGTAEVKTFRRVG